MQNAYFSQGEFKKIYHLKHQSATHFNVCAVKGPALWHGVMKRWTNDTLTPSSGWVAVSPNPPAANFPLPDHCLLSPQTTHPLPTLLSPPGLSVTSHPSKAAPSSSCSWLHQFTSCFISVLSLTLGYHFPVTAQFAQSIQTWLVPEDISRPPWDSLLKILTCFFSFLPSQLAFCGLFLLSITSASFRIQLPGCAAFQRVGGY